MWPFVARAQQGERVRRIGVLMSLAEECTAVFLGDDVVGYGLRPEGQSRETTQVHHAAD
jgi:hypothetical protein